MSTTDFSAALAAGRQAVQRAALFAAMEACVNNAHIRYQPNQPKISTEELEKHAHRAIENTKALGAWPQDGGDNVYVVPRETRVAVLLKTGVSAEIAELKADQRFEPAVEVESSDED